MDENEEKYRKELEAQGIEIPEVKAADDAEAKAKEEAEAKAKADDEEAAAKAKAEEEAEAKDLEGTQEKPKRSIYEVYKDEKSARKFAEERAQKAEEEKAELQRKLDAATGASDAKVEDATEDAVAYAKKIGADPDLVQRIIQDAQKGLKPEIDASLRKDLAEFNEWKKANQKVVEAQRFNEEFGALLPSLKSQYPNASEEEIAAIKSRLDVISHSKGWNDKDLDYIAFKHSSELAKLVSPRKRGMESKDRREGERVSSDFDPNADYSKMSLKEREEWEKQYHEAGKTEGLTLGANGKKTLI